MTKEKQLEAILKLSGWKVEPANVTGMLKFLITEPDGAFYYSRHSDNIPDFFNSRDDVAEVLERLKNSKEYPHFQEDYVRHLRMVVERDYYKMRMAKKAGVHWFEVCCATAEQQCEAILWATNKYTNE
jgi:hypothetical protein